MKYHVKTLKGCARLFEIEAEPKELKEALAEVFQDFQRVAHLPGFRVGKVPLDLVERHYGESAHKELLKRFIPTLYDRALQESHLKPVGLPEISDVLFENHKLSFKATVETKPEIHLRKYKGLKASRQKVTVSPEEIQESLRAIQEERSELAPKEGNVEEGDFVVCDVEMEVGGKTTDQRKNVLLSTSPKDHKHPEVARALLGAKIGEFREVDVALESPGGVIQKAHYRLRVNEIKRKILPEMNDDFAKAANFNTLKELEEDIAKEIQRQKEEKAKRELEKELLSQLNRECPFEVPHLLVEEEAGRLAGEERFHFQLLGGKDEEIEARLAQNKEQRLQEAERRVKNTLLLEKIAEIEKIEIRQEEIDERIRTFSGRLQRTEEEKEKDLANPSLRQRVAGEIFLDKALSVIVSTAHIQENP